MGLFSRKNKDEDNPLDALNTDDDLQVDIYTPQMLTKRLAWDIVPCSEVERLIPLMGLTPDSPDVSDMEHKASHDRIDALAPLKEMLALFIPIVSGITASAMLVNSGNSVDEETAAVLQRHHSVVVRAGIVAILANLLDMGIISYADGVQFGDELLG
ncbi:hypothetical protein EV284_3448 [Streptomyces sp. BK022]|uniref:hypothetical protein n=1 Tax=Streptomyces sp. BK022 TaxID=2512123 RepID=UPI00102A27E8|nr:hypothetical protein [Streptomyces sp. BK022]RZU35965.1 hypothetical protein EV284_3448 [Streptomyces sp. BK022]